MDSVHANFNDRLREIESYIELLMAVDEGIKLGQPSEPSLHTGSYKYKITPIQQKVMYAGVYLHLYNLIESTVLHLISAIEQEAERNHDGDLSKFNEKIRNLWIKGVVLGVQKKGKNGNTSDTKDDKQEKNDDSDPDARVKRGIELYGKIDGLLPFEMNVPKTGGGNWDNENILKLSDTIGVDLDVEPSVYKLVRRPIQDDLGPLRLIRSIRNKLAHGEISFAECAGERPVEHFIELFNVVSKYLSEIIRCYGKYIEDKKMLSEKKNEVGPLHIQYVPVNTFTYNLP